MKISILQKHILKMTIPNFFIGLMIFTLVHLTQYLYKFISMSIEKNIPFYKVLQLLIYIIPFLMTFIIPIGVFMGIILTMGELSANNEIIAMRTNGLSMKAIFKPFILFGLSIAILHVFFFQYILPWGNKNFVLTQYKLTRKDPTLEISKKKVFSDGEVQIRIGWLNNKTKVFYDVRIANLKENQIFIANEGKFLAKKKNTNTFPLKLKNVLVLPFIFKNEGHNLKTNYYHELTLQIKDFDIKRVMPKGSQLIGITDLMDKIQSLEELNCIAEIRNQHKLILREKSLSLAKAQLKRINLEANLKQKLQKDMLNHSAAVKQLKRNHRRIRERISPKNEVFLLHQKLSCAVGAILMAFLAVPLGIFKKRRGKEVAFGLGVLVVIVYEAIFSSGPIAWKQGYTSPINAAWMPNIIILVVISFLAYFKLKDNLSRETISKIKKVFTKIIPLHRKK